MGITDFLCMAVFALAMYGVIREMRQTVTEQMEGWETFTILSCVAGVLAVVDEAIAGHSPWLYLLGCAFVLAAIVVFYAAVGRSHSTSTSPFRSQT